MEDFRISATDRLAHLEESLKAAHKRIDSIDSLAKSVYEIASSLKTMQGNLEDVSDRIKTIEEKPAKRWDLIVTSAITTIGGLVIGYLFGK